MISTRDTSFVLDASIAICWCLKDEVEPAADAALVDIQEHGALVPAFFWFELRSVLLMAERKGRVSEAQTARSISFIKELAIRIDRDPVDTLTMSLARHHQLTIYDAAYLELAVRQVLPLATLDGALAQAARAEGVALIG